MQLLLYETNIQQIKNELQEKVKERVDKNQKEYILREEMKVIREELGEDNTISDIKQFEEALEKLEADDSVKERIQKEIARFKNVANSPSEGSVVRGYIETLLDLPWNKKSEDNTDLIYSFKSAHVVIESEEAVPWTLDGEFGGDQTRVEINNLHEAMNLYLTSSKKQKKSRLNQKMQEIKEITQKSEE